MFSRSCSPLSLVRIMWFWWLWASGSAVRSAPRQRSSPLVSSTLPAAQPASPWPNLEEVIVVSKTHFDIGYTDLASRVVDRYRTTMADQALKLVEESRGSAAGPAVLLDLGGLADGTDPVAGANARAPRPVPGRDARGPAGPARAAVHHPHRIAGPGGPDPRASLIRSRWPGWPDSRCQQPPR